MHTGEFVSKSVFTCSEADIQDFTNFTQGVLTQGLYTINEGYGICTPFDLDMLQGTPAVFLNDKRSLKPGDVKQWMIDEDINKRIKRLRRVSWRVRRDLSSTAFSKTPESRSTERCWPSTFHSPAPIRTSHVQSFLRTREPTAPSSTINR